MLLSQDPNGDITLQRAHREVELLSAVDSERVVKVLTDAVEIGEPPAAVCWAEEYLDGDDLRVSLNRTWDESEVWPLLHDMAEALAACFPRGTCGGRRTGASCSWTPSFRGTWRRRH